MHQRGWTDQAHGAIVNCRRRRSALLSAYAGTTAAEGFAITARAVNAIEDIAQLDRGHLQRTRRRRGSIEFAMFLSLVRLAAVRIQRLAGTPERARLVDGAVRRAWCSLSPCPISREASGWRLGIFMADRRHAPHTSQHGPADRPDGADAARCSTLERCLRSPASCSRSGLLVTASDRSAPDAGNVAPLGVPSHAQLDDTARRR